jgi:hypothetical protein
MVQCAGCDNGINGSYTSFNGQYYHPQCFNCSSCGTQLSNSQFYIVDGEASCGSCAAENSGPKCRKCRQSFAPGVPYKVLPEGNYHNDCFVCDGPCERPLAGSFYTIRNKRVCGNCYQQYGNDFEKYIKKKEEPKPEPVKEEPKKEPKKDKNRVPIYY